MKKKLLFILFLFMPMIVCAAENQANILSLIGAELFVSIFYALFISGLFRKLNKYKLNLKIVLIRLIILMFLNIYINFYALVLDMLGTMIMFPALYYLKKIIVKIKSENRTNNIIYKLLYNKNKKYILLVIILLSLSTFLSIKMYMFDVSRVKILLVVLFFALISYSFFLNNIKESKDLIKWSIYFSSIVVGIIISGIYFYNPKIVYEKYSNGYYVKTYINGIKSNDKLVIPEKYNNETVIGIDDYAFENNKRIKEIILPDSIVSIGEAAFSGTVNLKDIKLSESLTTIKKFAFYNAISLKNIYLKDNVTFIGDHAFCDCSSLENIRIPENNALTAIPNGAFSGCSSLKELYIPDNIININDYAFSSCKSLLYVEFSKNIKFISNSAFVGAEALTNVKLPSDTYVDRNAFNNELSIERYDIEEEINE